MINEPQSLSLLDREQYRMTRLQVFNWGTFSGLHDIPIAERGFLFVGRSGAGKSTLLDAFSALLIPPRWIDFNAAARESDRSSRDRNLVSYVRGAWAEQKDDQSGEIATRYLRPGTTWSALALTYRNSLNQFVVLVQLFWLRGNANGLTDLKRYYLIFERELDLKEFDHFAQSNFDIRKLKQTFPNVFIHDEYRPYCERFSRLLGIENEMALRLLHKTQSAKNLGDLNTFLRDFMLEKPATFEVAQRLVAEFGELNAAHQAVVIAREQVQTLTPARDEYQHLQMLQARRNEVKELEIGVDSYREKRRIKLLNDHLAKLKIDLEGIEGEITRREGIYNNHSSLLRDLEQQHREKGGAQIEQWEMEKRGLETQRAECLRKRGQVEAACQQLNWILPDSPQGFAELTGKARKTMEDWQNSATFREEQLSVMDNKKDAEKTFAEVIKEVNALRSQPSNIPAEMLELRRNIAAKIGLSESALPFVGELLQVKASEVAWQGAIERVLHGFALSLLVNEQNYTALSNYINEVNLGRRLVYYRTSHSSMTQPKPLAANSLALKLEMKEGEYAQWLSSELQQRFDYSCVDSLQAFRNCERALTREGQIKHNKTRHEKDDRKAISDRHYWILGFDNREKLLLFEKQSHFLADKISRLTKELSELTEREKQYANRALQCQTLVNVQWHEIDIAPLLSRMTSIEQQLRDTRSGNTALQELSQRVENQKKLIEEFHKEIVKAESHRTSYNSQIQKYSHQLHELQQDARIVSLTPHQQQGLDERFSRLKDSISIDTLDRMTTTIVQGLNREIEEINRDLNSNEKSIENRFADFKRRWPADASDVDMTLASAPDFFAKLVRLEADGLPLYEQRFFELLQNQSNQNLTALATYLTQARKTILERMELVNESLSRAHFNPGTYLRIHASDRQLVEVREFKQEIQQILSHAWSEEQELAEKRFKILQSLVERLASQEPEQRRWKESVLDVRQHVEFIGREIDEEGKEIETYRGGAGKSGGQRQKLATTCLAAALRYQLGGNERGTPIYAPVILDEAFDKADNEFTALAMNIFTNFGFQMIVATPLKSVMTLEPFIGGACFVDIRDRCNSGVLLIEYDSNQQRLQLPEQAHENSAEIS